MPHFNAPRFAGALIAGFVALAATGASASEQTVVVGDGHATTRTIEVRYGDLNLANAAGRDRLANRIAYATRRACGVGLGSTLDHTSDATTCVAQARQSAAAQLRERVPGHASEIVGVGMP